MTTAEPTLDEKAAEFATKLTQLTRGVLGQDSPSFFALTSGDRVRVVPTDADRRNVRIPITINEEHSLDLHVEYKCCWDGPGRFLAIDKADLHVYIVGANDPLMRYEYVRSCKEPPGAHLHVQAHRDEMAYLLRLSEKNKSKPAVKMKQRRLPRLAELHFPVGGHRFRPSLEDVLLMLEREFAIDVADGWRAVVNQHLEEWRLLQVKSVARDAHETAAEVLRELGYTVTAPEGIGVQRPGRLFWP